MVTKVVTEKTTYDMVGGEAVNARKQCEYYCNSGDAKPIEGVENGEPLLEMDTGKLFAFDKDAKAWLEQ